MVQYGGDCLGIVGGICVAERQAYSHTGLFRCARGSCTSTTTRRFRVGFILLPRLRVAPRTRATKLPQMFIQPLNCRRSCRALGGHKNRYV